MARTPAFVWALGSRPRLIQISLDAGCVGVVRRRDGTIFQKLSARGAKMVERLSSHHQRRIQSFWPLCFLSLIFYFEPLALPHVISYSIVLRTSHAESRGSCYPVAVQTQMV